jgi:hypothetical protein
MDELHDGHGDRALATIRRARETIDDPRLAYSEAIIANHLRKSSDAEAAARAATGGSPDIAERAYAILVSLAQQKSPDEGTRVLQEGLRRFPRSAILLERDAQRLFYAGDIDGAEQVLKTLESVGDPSTAKGIRAGWLISALAADGQLSDAMRAIDDAIADGAMSWTLVDAACPLLCRGGRPDVALSLMDHLDPDFAPDPAWIRNRVWALCMLGHVDEAVSLADRSPRRSDSDSDYDRAVAAETRAIAYVYARDDRAEADLRWLLRFEPDDEDLRKLIEQPSADGRPWRERLEGST